MRFSAVCTLLTLVALTGCREAPLAPEKAAGPEKAAAAEALVLPSVDPKIARLPLGDRLALEASARPPQAVRIEQLTQALAERGLPLARRRQVLASPLGASYCELAVTGTGVGVSVCEYPDGQTALAGEARSKQLFDSMLPGRTLTTRGNTLLTLTHPESELAEREAELILTVFAQQLPTARDAQAALTP